MAKAKNNTTEITTTNENAKKEYRLADGRLVAYRKPTVGDQFAARDLMRKLYPGIALDQLEYETGVAMMSFVVTFDGNKTNFDEIKRLDLDDMGVVAEAFAEAQGANFRPA